MGQPQRDAVPRDVAPSYPVTHAGHTCDHEAVLASEAFNVVDFGRLEGSDVIEGLVPKGDQDDAARPRQGDDLAEGPPAVLL